jgi:hypothetical protein
VHVAAEVRGAGATGAAGDAGVELIAAVTPEALRELALSPGAPVSFAFKAAAVRVF